MKLAQIIISLSLNLSPTYGKREKNVRKNFTDRHILVFALRIEIKM